MKSPFGLVMVVMYVVATGQANPYLDSTSRQPWYVALPLFMLVWIAAGLVPLLAAIIVLSIKGRSRAVLAGLHGLLARSWLTRRAEIGGDPLRWKERHVEGVATTGFSSHHAPLARRGHHFPDNLGIVAVHPGSEVELFG